MRVVAGGPGEGVVGGGGIQRNRMRNSNLFLDKGAMEVGREIPAQVYKQQMGNFHQTLESK